MNSITTSEPHARLIHHHRLAVNHPVGALRVDANLNLSSMWTILFGPSGSGKSSLLRAACGLLGREGIRLTRWQDHEASDIVLQDETTFVPPHLRAIRWAPQSDSLFPHLSVRENILFGTTASKPHDEAEIIALFKLEPLLNRFPRDLSGGERRRVSLARAFAAAGCQLMLLDEPFAGLDRALRDELLPKMRDWLRDRGIPTLSVTHDVEEAFQLQAWVVLIRDGKIEDEGYVSKALGPERQRLLASLAKQT